MAHLMGKQSLSVGFLGDSHIVRTLRSVKDAIGWYCYQVLWYYLCVDCPFVFCLAGCGVSIMMGAMNCDEVVWVIEDGIFHEARWSRVME